MPLSTVAAFVLTPMLLFAPADPGIPLVTVIYDRSDFAFSSEARCPHGGSADPAAELFSGAGGAPPADARELALDAAVDDGFWHDAPREEVDGFWRGRPRQAMPADFVRV